MKSLHEWRSSKINENAAWDQVKGLNLIADPSIKEFVYSIEKIQEQLTEKVKEHNPKIQTFRDVPPEMRDVFAQTIVSSVLDLFYEGMRSMPSNNFNSSTQIIPSKQNTFNMPQDELKTPIASKG